MSLTDLDRPRIPAAARNPQDIMSQMWPYRARHLLLTVFAVRIRPLISLQLQRGLFPWQVPISFLYFSKVFTTQAVDHRKGRHVTMRATTDPVGEDHGRWAWESEALHSGRGYCRDRVSATYWLACRWGRTWGSIRLSVTCSIALAVVVRIGLIAAADVRRGTIASVYRRRAICAFAVAATVIIVLVAVSIGWICAVHIVRMESLAHSGYELRLGAGV